MSIVGTSGSGKSTVGRAAAERLGIPYVELDAIRHLPNWEGLPDDEFHEAVGAVVGGESWVVDGNEGSVRQLTWSRATTIVWLDLPRWLVMVQVVWRSVTRAVLRTELWNGNRESVRFWLRPEHPMRWAWLTHGRRRREYGEQVDERWVRLRSRRDVRDWLDSLDRQSQTQNGWPAGSA